MVSSIFVGIDFRGFYENHIYTDTLIGGQFSYQYYTIIVAFEADSMINNM